MDQDGWREDGVNRARMLGRAIIASVLIVVLAVLSWHSWY